MKFSLLFILLSSPIFGQHITSYKPFTGYGICRSDQKELIVLRRFLKDADTCYLTVSPQSLKTKIIPADSIILTPALWSTIESRYPATPYIKAIGKAEGYSNPLHDAGIRHFMPSQKGIDLTVDLCPSHRPLDRIVFKDLIREIGAVEKPVPLAVSITGVWIKEHPQDFRWLDSLDRAGALSIVWINHSYNHHTYRNIPLKMNFMLAPGTDINSEVLNTEILLLKNNIVPSVFFRFPGLVSDREIYDRILNLGLIPVGSDAWLAKGQWPEGGSIVLIHANGNEPVGVKDFIQLLKKEQSEVTSKRWELFDLRESVVEENR
jgi:hypothetical protein